MMRIVFAFGAVPRLQAGVLHPIVPAIPKSDGGMIGVGPACYCPVPIQAYQNLHKHRAGKTERH